MKAFRDFFYKMKYKTSIPIIIQTDPIKVIYLGIYKTNTHNLSYEYLNFKIGKMGKHSVIITRKDFSAMLTKVKEDLKLIGFEATFTTTIKHRHANYITRIFRYNAYTRYDMIVQKLG